MIVVDIGCHPQGPEESVHKLIDRFQPDVLFGFDPFPELVEGVECVGETLVFRRRIAAWTTTGETRVLVDGICTGVDLQDERAVWMECFDLVEWLHLLPANTEIVLKLDAEGAEYPLLERIHSTEFDARLALVLVEWHPVETSHGFASVPSARPKLRCPVEEW